MNIGINGRVLTERKGGPYRYTVNLIKELANIDKKNKYYIFVNNNVDFNFYLPTNFKIIVKSTKSKIFFDYVFLPYASHKCYNIDIWVFPKNTFSPMIKGKTFPIFHDIVYFEKKLKFREFSFFDNLHHTIMIPINSKVSTMNIAVSDFTAQRMHKLLNIPMNKIRVIKEGVEDIFTTAKSKKTLELVKEKYNINLPFFFYSGSLSPRKNILNVLNAFDMVKNKLPHNLYLTGGYSWRDKVVHKYIEEKLANRVIKLGFVPDEDLVALYNLADCYLYPSLYEGFGLPILEAQACDCPVITSTESSCPEIAGEGALLVDPLSVQQIANAMLSIANNTQLKNKIVKAGKKNVRQYSWRKCAEEMLSLFEEYYTKPRK